MRGLLAVAVVFAMLLSASEATGAEQKKPKPYRGSNAVVQTEAPERTPSVGRSTGSNRATGASPPFRAEDIVPDICKGCS
ncbi:hypothetical protein [Bradyrhizobium archetypum]|jgi:hypothetical protein|uniref:Secreted protein n=1 Tax=Bradyrhizobium archetypum TaxID=2721160 RepID=A0A7Y4H8B6_9BRAD|nr:hypothetical protein [Bradyrhizobium archetypum]NOJ49057.1 hypothetical protein [Bradyrhizobium archetypum]